MDSNIHIFQTAALSCAFKSTFPNANLTCDDERNVGEGEDFDHTEFWNN